MTPLQQLASSAKDEVQQALASGAISLKKMSHQDQQFVTTALRQQTNAERCNQRRLEKKRKSSSQPVAQKSSSNSQSDSSAVTSGSLRGTPEKRMRNTSSNGRHAEMIVEPS